MADLDLGRLGNKLGPLPVWAWGVAGAGVIVGLSYVAQGRKPKQTADLVESQDSARQYGATGGKSDTGGGNASTGTGNGVDLGGVNAQLAALQNQYAALSSLTKTGFEQIGAGAEAPQPAAPVTRRRTTSPSAVPARTLRQGARGADVKRLQQQLADAGFNPGPVDAVFGSQTAKALQAYQRSRGLQVDSVAGPQTLGALASGKPTAQRATPPPPLSGTPGPSLLPVAPLGPWTPGLST